MDSNEKESIINGIAEMEAAIEACTKNVEDGEAKAKAFRAKRVRCRQKLIVLNRKLRVEE